MPVAIALIRGINVGGKNMLPMQVLRTLCESIGLCDVRTHIQSGNVIFRCPDRILASAATKLEAAIEKERGFRPRVIVRSLDELKRIALSRVFPDHDQLDPSRLLVMFLAAAPDVAARPAVEALKVSPERVAVIGTEAFLYYPAGVGKSRLSMGAVEKALGTAGTARNWNTVTKLLAMVEELETTKVPVKGPRRARS